MAVYDIRVTGDLDPHFSEWFDGLTITNLASGVAVLCGESSTKQPCRAP